MFGAFSECVTGLKSEPTPRAILLGFVDFELLNPLAQQFDRLAIDDGSCKLRHLAPTANRDALEQYGPIRVAWCNQPGVFHAESIVQRLLVDRYSGAWLRGANP